MLGLFICINFNFAEAQTLEYHEYRLFKGLQYQTIPIKFSLTQKTNSDQLVYCERQQLRFDSLGQFKTTVGSGKVISGSFQEIIWSEGSYMFKIAADTNDAAAQSINKEIGIRIPTDLNRPHVEGQITEKGNTGSGALIIPNPYGRRPLKITLDLSTSYVNVDYPAGNYPVYRHFEWFDEDGDGKGNAINLTFSEKTNHAIFLQSQKIGEVKLFPKAFQEFVIAQLDNQIEINISKPEAITYFNQTYAIKGPWKVIYYVEWDY
jgi:hypothetical protein